MTPALYAATYPSLYTVWTNTGALLKPCRKLLKHIHWKGFCVYQCFLPAFENFTLELYGCVTPVWLEKSRGNCFRSVVVSIMSLLLCRTAALTQDIQPAAGEIKYRMHNGGELTRMTAVCVCIITSAAIQLHISTNSVPEDLYSCSTARRSIQSIYRRE